MAVKGNEDYSTTSQGSAGLLSNVKNFLFSFNAGVSKEVSSFLTSVTGAKEVNKHRIEWKLTLLAHTTRI
jgi:hypothetical protein